MAVKIETSSMDHLKGELLSVCNKITLYGHECLFLSVDLNTVETFCCGSSFGEQFLIAESAILGMFVKFCKTRSNLESSKMLPTKHEVIKSDGVVCISDDDDDDDNNDEGDGKMVAVVIGDGGDSKMVDIIGDVGEKKMAGDAGDGKMTDVVIDDVPIIDITEEDAASDTKENTVDSKILSKNTVSISDITRREKDDAGEVKTQTSSKFESEIYKQNRRNVEILPATSTVNDSDINESDVMMPMGNNNSNVMMPIENNNSNVMMPIENNNNNMMMPIENNNSNVMMPIENNNSNVMMPMGNNNSNVMMPKENNNSNVMMPIENNNSNVMMSKGNNKNGVMISMGEENGDSCADTCDNRFVLKYVSNGGDIADDENESCWSNENSVEMYLQFGDTTTTETIGETQTTETVGGKQNLDTTEASEALEILHTLERNQHTEQNEVRQAEQDKVLDFGYNPSICNVCGKQYIRKSELKEHAKVHDMVKSSKKGLEHAQGHTKGKSFKRSTEDVQGNHSNLVNKSKKSSENTQSHSKEKSEKSSENKYECSFCFRIFRSYQNLKKHLSDHVKRKPHSKQESVSTQSDSEISNSSDKSADAVSVKPHRKMFECNVCSTVCRSRYLLMKHVRFVHSPNDNFKCKDCSTVYRSKHLLEKHVRFVHSPDDNFKCKVCSTVYRSKYLLAKHVKSVHSPYDDGSSDDRELVESSEDGNRNSKKRIKQPHKEKRQLRKNRANFSKTIEGLFQCKQCKKKFHTRHNLTQHSSLIHGNKKRNLIVRVNRIDRRGLSQSKPIKSTCLVCGLEFRNDDHLKWHAKIHVGNKPFQCGFCGKTESTKKNMMIHWKIHETGYKRKLVKCSLCSKIFSSSMALCDHRKSMHYHDDMEKRSDNLKQNKRPTLNKKHKCKLCSDVFPSSLLLRVHSRQCNSRSTKSYLSLVCQICYKRFSQERHLRNHLKYHKLKDTKRFQCDVCDAKFTLKHHLQRHSQTHNKPIKNIDHSENSESQKGFTTYQCKKCGICFLQQKFLESHMNKCICSPSSVSLQKMENTEKKTRRKRPSQNIKCSSCGKLFTHVNALIRHLAVHWDEKLFKCSLCSKSFYNLPVLKWHLSSHFDKKTYQCDVCHIKVFNAKCLRIHKKIHNI